MDRKKKRPKERINKMAEKIQKFWKNGLALKALQSRNPLSSEHLNSVSAL
jgi:hypothetical protein